MSGYHYSEQPCCNQFSNCNYHDLKNINADAPLPSCLNRGNSARSTRDMMDYNFYVLNKPMNLLPMPQENSRECNGQNSGQQNPNYKYKNYQ